MATKIEMQRLMDSKIEMQRLIDTKTAQNNHMKEDLEYRIQTIRTLRNDIYNLEAKLKIHENYLALMTTVIPTSIPDEL